MAAIMTGNLTGQHHSTRPVATSPWSRAHATVATALENAAERGAGVDAATGRRARVAIRSQHAARHAAALQPYDYLAEVLAAQHGEEGVDGLVDPVDDGLLEGDLPVAYPGTHLGLKGAIAVVVVADDEPAQREPL